MSGDGRSRRRNPRDSRPIPATRAAPTGTRRRSVHAPSLFYFAAWENYGTVYRKEESEYQPGRNFLGGGFTVVAPAAGAPTIGIGRRGPINNWTDEVGHGAVMAVDPQTGAVKWKFQQFDVSDSGMLTTASDLLFTGGREGHFHALDATTGRLLWRSSLGGQIVMAPITYQVEGKQYLSVIAGGSLVTFGLREARP